ncbi:MAG: hypothetical protein KatS3mg038_1018 [Candidatus Kapaibacterium sp.]|nr:MAG: hypothetical protein KatS3mg038_1018 [Candidatus Kapabacteria bacterium]
MSGLFRGIRNIFQRTQGVTKPVGVPLTSEQEGVSSEERIVALKLEPGWGNITPIRASAIKSSADEAEIMSFSGLRITVDPYGFANAYIASVWAFRCIQARATAVGQMKWNIVNKRTGRVCEDHPMAKAIMRRADLLQRIEWSLCIWGEAFLEKQRNAFNRPAGLGWLNPLGMQVDTSLGYIRGFNYTSVNGGEYVNYGPDEIVFLKTLNPYDDLRGLAPLIPALQEVVTDRDIAAMMRSFYANDARPGILLVPREPLSEMDMERFLAFWKATYGGPRNAGKPALVPYDLEVREVQRAPTQDDAQLRESIRREICAALGVPLSYAGAWDSSTYQSSPEQRRAFYEDTIVPECNLIAAALNEQAMPFFDDSAKHEFRFDYSDILTLSELRATREQILTARWQQGLMTLNEVRREIGLPPFPNGDVLLVGGSMIPVAEIGRVARSATEAMIANVGGASDALDIDTSSAEPLLGVEPRVPQKPQEPEKPDEPQEAERPQEAEEAQEPEKPVVEMPRALKEEAAAQLYILSAGKAKVPQILIPRAVRASAAQWVSPKEAQEYWEEHDKLVSEIGNQWLREYQAEVWERVRQAIESKGAFDANALSSAMSELENALLDVWVGTPEAPGVFTKLIVAGAVAGKRVLRKQRMWPTRKKAAHLIANVPVPMGRAIEWARAQAGLAIRRINKTTRRAVRKVLSEWAASGKPLSSLIEELRKIFLDTNRAARIAQTESTAAYQKGAESLYRENGIVYLRFQTVRDERVCPICAPLHNTIAPIDTGWRGIIRGNSKPPIHVGCRCFTRPVTQEEVESGKWRKWEG